MKIERISINLPNMPVITIENIDCAAGEFEKLLDAIIKLQEMEVKKIQLYTENREVPLVRQQKGGV